MELISTCTALPWKASVNVKLDSRFRKNLTAIRCDRAQIGWKICRKCSRKAKNSCFSSFHGLRYRNTGWFDTITCEKAHNSGYIHFKAMKVQATKREMMYKFEKIDVIEDNKEETIYNIEKMKVIEGPPGRFDEGHRGKMVIEGAKADMVYDSETGELRCGISSYRSVNINSLKLDSYNGQQEKEEKEQRLHQGDSFPEEEKEGKVNLRSISGLKQWWKSIHEVYRQETEIWGFGSSPIFTVYEGKGGKIEKVVIDENEIRRRQGIEPFLPGLTNDTMKALCEDKIRLAHAIAKDMELGHRKPTKNSTIFTILKTIDKDTTKSSYQQTIDRVKYVLHVSAPSVKSFFLIAMPIYGLYTIWNAFMVRRSKSARDDFKEETSAARLEKMRKLKARIKSIHANTTLEEAPLEQSNFMKTILEVRQMARQVRSDEASQMGNENSAKVLQYDLEDEIVNGNNNMNEVNNDMKQGGIEAAAIMDSYLEDRTVSETHVVEANGGMKQGQLKEEFDHVVLVEEEDLNPSQVSNGESNSMIGNSRDIINETTIVEHPKMNGSAQKSNNSGMNSRRSMKPKPRIIMSLEEAETVLNSKKSRLSSINRNDEKHTPRMQDQIADESMVGITSHNRLTETKPSEGDNSESKLLKTLKDRAGESQTESLKFKDETQNHDTEAKEQQNGRLKWESSPLHSKSFDGENSYKEKDQLHTLNNQENQTKSNDMVQKSLKISGLDSRSSGTNKILIKKGFPSRKTRDVVGGGRPLRDEGSFSNTKRWTKELQRKYDSEQDPSVRKLIKEMGSELQSWVTEEEIEEARRLALKLEQGDDDDDDGDIGKRYQEVRKKIENEKKTFGTEAVLEKYREYQAKPEDELWWLDLRHVLCLVVSSKEDGGFYGVDMEIEELKGESRSQRVKHVVAFEDRKDALKFGRLLEHDSGSGYRHVDIYPFSPKQLFRMAKEEGFKVTVLKTGQIEVSIESSLEEVEDQIVAIAKNVYWEREERKHSIDIDSILHQRFGL